MRLFLSINFRKGFMNYFFVIVFDGGQFAQFTPFFIVTFFGVAFLPLQLEVAEGAQQSDFFPH